MVTPLGESRAQGKRCCSGQSRGKNTWPLFAPAAIIWWLDGSCVGIEQDLESTTIVSGRYIRVFCRGRLERVRHCSSALPLCLLWLIGSLVASVLFLRLATPSITVLNHLYILAFPHTQQRISLPPLCGSRRPHALTFSAHRRPRRPPGENHPHLTVVPIACALLFVPNNYFIASPGLFDAHWNDADRPLLQQGWRPQPGLLQVSGWINGSTILAIACNGCV
jgi:hypothetical protein